MTLTNFNEVPQQFHLCTNADCPWHTTCLRQIAMRLVPDSVQGISIINPNLTAHPEATPQGNSACPFYRENRTVTYARGFIGMERRMTVEQFRRFRAECLSIYTRNPFYERRKGVLALSPSEQATLCRIFHRIGFSGDIRFDQTEERIDWDDSTLQP